jgi:GNAT superfamily N-acetyltransferase
VVHEVAPDGRRELASLFRSHPPHLRAGIASVLEGRLGRAWISGDGAAVAARLSVGCYDVFGGDSDSAAAEEVSRGVDGPRELVHGNDPRWDRRLREIFGGRLSERPMRSYDGEDLATAPLRELAAALPSDVSLRAIDERSAGQLDAELSPHALQVYASAAEFLGEGFGFGVFAGDRLACAATSYAVGGGAVEVAIATRPAFRGRGYAASASARLLLEAVARGLAPHWNASNPVSQRLAVRLGLRPAGICEVLYLV